MAKKAKPDIDYKNLIMYRGSNPLREAEEFKAHGLLFKKNIIYEVTDDVMEYLKAQKYFVFPKGKSNKVVKFK